MRTDIDLLNCYACTSDATAFAVLVDRHAVFVFNVALRITRNAADAEDVAKKAVALEAWANYRAEKLNDPPQFKEAVGVDSSGLPRSGVADHWPTAMSRRYLPSAPLLALSR